jgi:hypothetical protein
MDAWKSEQKVRSDKWEPANCDKWESANCDKWEPANCDKWESAEPDLAGRVHVLTRARTHRRTHTHPLLPAVPAGPHLPDGRQTEPRAGRPRVLLRHQHPGSRAAGLTPPTSAPGLGSPRPDLRRDWARPPTSAPGLGSPRPRLHRDWADPSCAQCPNYVPSMFKTQEDGPGY